MYVRALFSVVKFVATLIGGELESTTLNSVVGSRMFVTVQPFASCEAPQPPGLTIPSVGFGGSGSLPPPPPPPPPTGSPPYFVQPCFSASSLYFLIHSSRFASSILSFSISSSIALTRCSSASNSSSFTDIAASAWQMLKRMVPVHCHLSLFAVVVLMTIVVFILIIGSFWRNSRRVDCDRTRWDRVQLFLGLECVDMSCSSTLLSWFELDLDFCGIAVSFWLCLFLDWFGLDDLAVFLRSFHFLF